MICFLRPHLLCFSHSSRWLAQGREKETERAEGRLGEHAAISQGLMFPWWPRLRWDKRYWWWWCWACKVDGRQSTSITHTHTRARAYARTHALMGPNNHSVMVECVCVTDRQVRGLLVTWLSAELCHSYLLWPLTSIPPQLLCAPLWCIYTNANAQATEGKEVRQCEKISKQNHLFWFNDTM